MNRNLPAPAPSIPGYSYERHLGSGGFADVYLYVEDSLDREVAIKVLTVADGEGVRKFTDEAGMMARVSQHRAMVTIFARGVLPDGAPYIAMQYYPRLHLGRRVAAKPLSMAEALSVGVTIGGAVETLHRFGILHRDIKPDNILLDDQDRPHLSDFGISTTLVQARAGHAAGLSIDWSPPEVLESMTIHGPRADVYSLGATVYALLAGHAPFHLVGGDNSEAAMIERIMYSPLPRLGRADVSPLFEDELRRAMDRDPLRRHATAKEFAVALQRIQRIENYTETELEITVPRARTEAEVEAESAGTGTKLRETGPPGSLPEGADASAKTAADSGVGEGVPESAPPAAATSAPERRPQQPAAAAPPPPPRRRRTRRAGAIVAVVLAALAAVLAVAIPSLTSGGGDSPGGQVEGTLETETVPTVTDLDGVRGGDSVTFTWSNPDPRSGDSYLWVLEREGVDPVYTRLDSTTLTVPAQTTGETCVAVLLTRESGRAAVAPARGCVP